MYQSRHDADEMAADTFARQAGFWPGFTIALVSIAPVIVGTATVVYKMPTVFFNASGMLAVVVSVAALLEHHTDRLIGRLDALDARITEQDEAWRATVKNVREEIRKAVLDRSIDYLTEQTTQADIRAINRNAKGS